MEANHRKVKVIQKYFRVRIFMDMDISNFKTCRMKFNCIKINN
jgi:hypothetical protein